MGFESVYSVGRDKNHSLVGDCNLDTRLKDMGWM